MRLAILVPPCISLFFMNSAMAEETYRSLEAATTIYKHVIEVDATITECSRIDLTNRRLYEEIGEEFHTQTGETVAQIGFLVGQEARRLAWDKKMLLDAIDDVANVAVENTEQFAKENPRNFIRICEGLPQASASHTTPFRLLREQFPEEIREINRALRNSNS